MGETILRQIVKGDEHSQIAKSKSRSYHKICGTVEFFLRIFPSIGPSRVLLSRLSTIRTVDMSIMPKQMKPTIRSVHGNPTFPSKYWTNIGHITSPIKDPATTIPSAIPRFLSNHMLMAEMVG